MFTKVIEPRFSETDALGHINNNSYSVWFEVAREPIFKIFTPVFKIEDLNLIMAHVSCDFLKEVFFGKEIIIKTAVEKVGNTSLHITQALYQENKLCSIGKAVMIHFDHKNKKTISIDAQKRESLEKHLLQQPWDELLV